MTPIRLDQLTFTRFVAAMSVVVFHFANRTFPFDTNPIHRLFFTEAIAVSYFFVLSGFIMAVVHYRPGEPIDRFAYWNARFARIYPIYVAALAVPVIETVHAGNPDFVAMALGATLLQAWVPPYPVTLNGPGWSLSVEVFFYALFPFIVLRAATWSDRKLIALTAALWIATQTLHAALLNHRYGGYPSRSHDFIFYNPLLHLSTFAVGVTTGMLLVRHRARIALPRYAATAIWVFGCAAAALVMIESGALNAALGFRLSLNNGALAPLFAALIAALALDDSSAARLLRNPQLILLGEASYAVYLLQVPLHSIYNETLYPTLDAIGGWQFYVYATLLTAVSIAAFVWIERPARVLIRGWYDARRLHGQRAA